MLFGSLFTTYLINLAVPNWAKPSFKNNVIFGYG